LPALRLVAEGPAAGALEGGLRLGIDLQVELLADDDGDEQLVDIEAVAAEHALRPRRAERGEQLDAVGGEGVARGVGHRSLAERYSPSRSQIASTACDWFIE
jgi:hypothetical protein